MPERVHSRGPGSLPCGPCAATPKRRTKAQGKSQKNRQCICSTGKFKEQNMVKKGGRERKKGVMQWTECVHSR